MAEIAKKSKRYLTDEEWAIIEPFLPVAAKRGRQEDGLAPSPERASLHGAFGWRMLPKDFLPWQTVYWWFRRFVRRFMFRTIHDVVLMIDRERTGHKASPTGGTIDSQSVKVPEAKTRVYDAGKDTDGRLLMVLLTPADVSDNAGAQMILYALRKRWPWLKHQFADGACDRTKLMDKAAFLDFTIDVVKRSDSPQGFEILPRRKVVERTFGRGYTMAPPRTRL
jgi:putative transposase